MSEQSMSSLTVRCHLPVMYSALSYNYRIVNGREAVSFLVWIKDAIEDPQRLLLDL